MMQISASDYYQRTPRSCSARRESQLTAAASTTAITSTSSNITGNNTTTENSFRISTTVKASELWCCCCNCTTARTAKAPGFLACFGVCVLVFGYTLLGAFAFMALEGGFKTDSSSDVIRLSNPSGSTTKNVEKHSNTGKTSFNVPSKADATLSPAILPTEYETDNVARELRVSTVERLWSITEDLNVLYKDNWTRLAEREILDFQDKMTHNLNRDRSSTFSVYSGTIQRSSRGHERYKDSRATIPDRRWTFGGSLLYSLTLITTIGYGSVAPRTVWGRVITIVYALAGIPLMLVYLSTVGDVFARTFRRLYGRVCHRGNDCNKKRKSTNGQFFVPSPQMPSLMEKSYDRYDNHIETTKLAPSNFYSSKDTSCDELGVRATGGTILLDRDGLESNLYLHSTSSTNALQDPNLEKRHLHPCSQMALMPPSVGYGTDTICVVRIPISLCLFIILLYVCGGAFIFHRLEGWSLLESSYFCFTSLGTIGFGDLVPTGKNSSTKLMEELSLCICSLYILIGMGLIAMCFNLMQEEVVRVVRVFGRTCGTTGQLTTATLGTAGMNSELDEDGCIGGNLLTNNCRQASEQNDDGIAMSSVDEGELLVQHRLLNNKFSSPGRHSLPRKKTSTDGRGAFVPKNHGAFSSTAHPQHGTSSFVRNGLSPLQHPHQRGDGCHSQQDDNIHFEYFVPRSISEFNLAATSVQDIAVPVPPPVSVLKPCSIVTTSIPLQIKSNTNAPSGNSGGTLGTRSREKMVTFEDENCSSSTPTRKNFGSTIENVFI
ncbi:hypothetical protein PV326_013215 [Microctonus aethiopoides]|nr:hypothetical protein PV326_013215 [Microctonus aethiopoides]